jgi:multidrug efflux system outer membrane protein
MRSRAPAIAAIVVASTLGGCMTLGPDYRRPDLSLPGAFAGASSADASAAVPADWWTLYGDATLDRLVAEGLERNADVRLAVARIEEAEGLLREANASFFPQVNANAQYTRQRITTLGGTPVFSGFPLIRQDYLLTASTAFELDLWGRLRRASESARAGLLGTVYARDTVRLTLAGSVAQAYFAVRSLDQQLAVLRETIGTRADALRLTEAQARGGIVSDLDVNQAAETLAQASAQAKEIARQRDVFVNQLGQLTGAPALAVPTANVDDLAVPALPPPGLPSTLLERRPDVRQAEAALASATALIGVARAAQFPTFSLTGTFGGQSRALEDITLPGARVWSFGGGLVGPILDFGRYRARTAQAEARARQAEATYEQTVRTAFREVADALGNVRQTQASEADLRERVARSRESLRLARLRYESGYAAFITVLDAQRTLNDASLALVQNRQALLAYTVDLMRALGGGWTDPARPAAEQGAPERAAPGESTRDPLPTGR